MSLEALFDGMLLPAVAIVVGVLIGLLRGGAIHAILGSPVRAWPVLVAGAVVQFSAEQFDVPGRLSLYVTGSCLLVVAALLNTHLKGAIIAGLGLTANLAVVVANGHVPIRFESLVAVGEVAEGTDPDLVSVSGLWELENSSTSLPQLGDIVPLPLFSDVVSFGDLILTAGLIVLTMNLVLHTRRVGVDVEDILAEQAIPQTEEIDLQRTLDLLVLEDESGLSTPSQPRRQTIDVRDLIDLTSEEERSSYEADPRP